MQALLPSDWPNQPDDRVFGDGPPQLVYCPCTGAAVRLPSGAYECLACGRTFTLEHKPPEAPKP